MKACRLLIVLLLILSLFSEAEAAEKKIIHISSYHQGYHWSSNCSYGIASIFGREYHIKNLYLNTKIIPQSAFKKSAEKAWKKLIKYKPDLVILGDDNALKLIGPEVVRIKIPLVYYGINGNPREYFNGTIPDGVYGVIERPLIFPWYRFLKEMVPGLKKVLVLSDNSFSARAVINNAFYGKKSMAIRKVVFELVMSDSWKEWKKQVSEAEKNYQVVIVANHFTIKKRGKAVKEIELIKKISALSKLPLFGINENTVNSGGFVGAMVIEGKLHGKIAGRIAKNILEGKKNKQKHVVQKAGTIYFNRKQLKRFKLKVPEGISGNLVFK